MKTYRKFFMDMWDKAELYQAKKLLKLDISDNVLEDRIFRYTISFADIYTINGGSQVLQHHCICNTQVLQTALTCVIDIIDVIVPQQMLNLCA
jgi:hypothetical protein